ncbi:hypothetical protein [Daejeonella lutea]|uniref:Uncharacterized protein n=1 Tax=Daejeonella lutea TaxID=572036 RepID=A0A1T5CWF1_9SPHI|nr:hypothetical protein [Daejeonella lutea]SKB63845.1 hypothetical protein SAMN05661099_1963 [Daejeonella lutea]
MHTFKTKPDGFRQIRRSIIFCEFPLLFLSLSTGLLAAAIGKPDRSIDWSFIGAVLLVVLVILAVLLLNILTERRHIYEDFLLTIDENGITREQYNANVLTVGKDEVREIYKTSNGGIVINGVGGSDPINIPPQMEQSDKLERLFSEIKPFSTAPILEKYKFQIIFTFLALFAAFNFVTSKPLVWVSGFMLLSFDSYLLYKIYQHTNLRDVPKGRLILALYFVFIIIRKVYSTTGG